MYREILPDQKSYNFLMHQGGLGDLLAHLPVIKYVLDNHPHLFVDLWIHDYGVPLCEKIFKDYENLQIKGVSRIGKEFNQGITRSPYIHKISNLSSHLVDHGFYTMIGGSVEDKHKNYIQLEPIDISKFNLPEKYVVVTTGFTSPSREWKPESINGVVDYIIEKGYTPVFLGKGATATGVQHVIVGNFNADFSRGINLIDKTNLFEAHSIMNSSSATIGVDNGLLHLNSMGKAKSVWGFTTVAPYHRLPYKDGILGKDCLVVVPDESLACRFCQSNMNFADTTHDFMNCFYKDYKCLDMLPSEKWIKELEKIL